jgi:hypothetical protein
MTFFIDLLAASFAIPESMHSNARNACVTLGIMLFGMAYSPGARPVALTYSAEAYPLFVRSYGMSKGIPIRTFCALFFLSHLPQLLLASTIKPDT